MKKRLSYALLFSAAVCIAVFLALAGSRKNAEAVTHHWGSWTTYSAATCTKNRVEQHKCTDKYCYATEQREVAGTALGHNWQDESVVSRATCTADGAKKQKCSRCGIGQTVSIPKTGHSYSGVVKRQAATCTADGWEGVQCNNCGTVPNKTTIKSPGHKWQDESIITKATCTADGSKKQKCATCGSGRTVTIPKTGHSYSGVVKRQAATCTADGWEGVQCNNCGTVPNKTVIPSPGHKWQDETVVAKATCTADGSKKQKCATCGSGRTVTIPKTGHSYTGVVKRQAATCTADGWEGVQCNNCGEVPSKTIIKAPGHKWQDETVVAKATCTADGSKKQKCATCGSGRTVTIPKTGHSYTGVVKRQAATCTADGWEGVQCNNCGEVPSKTIIKAPGHKWQDETVVAKATCTADGSKKQKCATCGSGRTVAIPKTGHSYTGVVKRQAPTCTADGWEGVQCNNCGEVPSKTIIKAPGHQWKDDYVIAKETCTTDGTMSQKCSVCQAIGKRAIPKTGHSYSGVVKRQAATCTADGWEGVQCNNCGTVPNKTTIKAPGHQWKDDYVIAKETCTTDGTMSQKCSVCQAIGKRAIPKTGHSYSGVIKRQAATCTEDGWEGVQCNNCGEVPSKTIIKSPGHQWKDDYVIAKETCTTDGTMSQKCSVCQAIGKRAIPKTGHSYSGVIKRQAPTCTEDGWEGVQCNNCGEVPSKSPIKAPGHKWQDEYVILKETCTANGSKRQKCTVCEDIQTVAIPKTGHSYSGVIKSQKPTCTTEGWHGVQCNNCGTVPTKIVLPKTDHVLGEWTFVVAQSTEARQVYARYCTNPACGYYVTGVLGVDVRPEDVPSIDINNYIDYDANGGTGTVNRTYFKGNEAIVAHNAFSKTGYVFCYWNSDPGEWGNRYHEGDSMKRDYIDRLLYAIWYPIEYTVQYDINAYGERNPSSQIVTYDDTTSKFPLPERDGYEFRGWMTYINGRQVYYTADSIRADGTIRNLTTADGAVITFTAQWAQNDDHVAISLYDGDEFKDRLELDKGDEKKLDSIKKYGMTNLGWTTVKNGSTVEYENNTKYPFERNLTLYAVWPSYYEISFYDGDTLVGKNGAATGKSVKMNSAVERTGQFSSGWATTKNASTATYSNGKSYYFSGNTNVYAVWEQFTLNYDANGGYGGPASKSAPLWGSITISSEKPSRSGYSFGGWSFSSGEDNYPDFHAGDPYYAGIGVQDRNQTIYAVWVPNTYKIIYNYNYPGAESSTVTKDYGTYFKPEKPTRTGYKFTGWRGYAEGHQIYISPDSSKVRNLITVNNGVVYLTAGWEKLDDYYSVTLYSAGRAVSQKGVKKGKQYMLPYSLNEIDVTGWTTQSNGTASEYDPGQSVTINSNMNFYALWDNITITFDLNGGVGGPTQKSISGPASGIKIPAQEPTRAGYVFNGWWVKEAHAWESADFQAGDTYDYGYNATLSAVWLEITYSPLKKELQDEYGTTIMKDEYFTQEYESTSWQKIADKKYFIIKTTKLSESYYYTRAYIIYKDGDTIRLSDKGSSTDIIMDFRTYVLEHTNNDVGTAFAVTYDLALDVAESLIEAGIASTGPSGVIAVLTYETATMVMDWAEDPNGGQMIFDSVNYGVSNAETYEIEFVLNCEVPFDKYFEVAGYINTSLSAYLEQYERASQNLDPYGDRDVAIATFKERIAADGFDKSVYYSGLIDLIYNQLY